MDQDNNLPRLTDEQRESLGDSYSVMPAAMDNEQIARRDVAHIVARKQDTVMLTEEDHLIFRARTSVAAQAALHKADRRDARVMDGLRNSLPLGDVKHEVWALQTAPLGQRLF